MEKGNEAEGNKNQEANIKIIDTKEVVYRTIAITRDAIDEETRTIALAFSSEEPYARYNMSDGEYFEVLGHKDGEMDTSFIGSGRAPLLLDHDKKNQIGVVTSVEVSEGRARALVKVSRSKAATEIWNDIVDGIRGNVSVGYYVTKQQEVKEKTRDGKKVIRAVEWRPIEVSIVSIPADETVGIGRATNKQENEVDAVKQTADTEEIANRNGEIIMSDKNKETPEVKLDIEGIKHEAAQAEQARVREIAGLGARFAMTSEADEFVKNNKKAEEFRSYVLENMETKTASTEVKEDRSDASIGLTTKEVRSFSIMRALRTIAYPSSTKARSEAGFEYEVSKAAMEQCGIENEGVMIPHEVLTRVLTAGGSATGDEFVGTDIQGGSLIELLRNKALVASLGVTSLSGLRGNVSIPKHVTSGSAGWVDPENAGAADSTQGTGQIVLTPRTIGASSEMSRQFINQSSVNAEQFVQNDLLAAIGLAVDLAVFYGSGASGEPTGIQNAVTQVVARFANAVPTRGEIITLETEVDTANALLGNVHYVCDAAMRGALKNAVEDTGSGQFVYKSDNTLNGYDTQVSNQITDGDLFFGNFADVILASWGGLSIQLDPFTGGRSGTIRINILQDADIAIRHAESFAWNNDTV